MAWEIDPSHSAVTFSVKHMMFSTVRGQFKVISGHLHIDEQHPENSWVDAQVDASSIDTRDEKRDAHLNPLIFLMHKSIQLLHLRAQKLSI